MNTNQLLFAVAVVIGMSSVGYPKSPSPMQREPALAEKVEYVVQRCAYLYDTTDDPKIEQYTKDILGESDKALPYIIDVFAEAKTPVYARFAVIIASHLHVSDKRALRGFIRSIISKSRNYTDEEGMIRQSAIMGVSQWGEPEDAVWLGNQAADPSIDSKLIFFMGGAIDRMGDLKGLEAFRDSLKKRMANTRFTKLDTGSQKEMQYSLQSAEETISKLEKAIRSTRPGNNVGEHSANGSRKEEPGARMGANSSASSGNSRAWLIVLGLLVVSVVGIGAWILLSKKRNR